MLHVVELLVVGAVLVELLVVEVLGGLLVVGCRSAAQRSTWL